MFNRILSHIHLMFSQCHRWVVHWQLKKIDRIHFHYRQHRINRWKFSINLVIQFNIVRQRKHLLSIEIVRHRFNYSMLIVFVKHWKWIIIIRQNKMDLSWFLLLLFCFVSKKKINKIYKPKTYVDTQREIKKTTLKIRKKKTFAELTKVEHKPTSHLNYFHEPKKKGRRRRRKNMFTLYNKIELIKNKYILDTYRLIIDLCPNKQLGCKWKRISSVCFLFFLSITKPDEIHSFRDIVDTDRPKEKINKEFQDGLLETLDCL